MLRTLGIIGKIRACRSDEEVMRNGLNNDGCEGGGRWPSNEAEVSVGGEEDIAVETGNGELVMEGGAPPQMVCRTYQALHHQGQLVLDTSGYHVSKSQKRYMRAPRGQERHPVLGASLESAEWLELAKEVESSGLR